MNSPAHRPSTRVRTLALATLFLASTLPWPSIATAANGSTRARQAEAEWSHDGLHRTRIDGIDLAYVRDGARVDAYDKVWLKSVEVAFRRDWQVPAQPGSRIASADLTRIKDGLARIVRDAATRELAKGGLQVVEAPGEGVLEVDVSIVDLYLNAPDVGSSLPVRRYTMSVGEMTLVAELRDSPSGEIVARVLDRRIARDRGQFELTTAVDNAAEAREAAQSWSRILVQQLQAARRPPAGSR